jgi:hypothetical protein
MRAEDKIHHVYGYSPVIMEKYAIVRDYKRTGLLKEVEKNRIKK